MNTRKTPAPNTRYSNENYVTGEDFNEQPTAKKTKGIFFFSMEIISKL